MPWFDNDINVESNIAFRLFLINTVAAHGLDRVIIQYFCMKTLQPYSTGSIV